MKKLLHEDHPVGKLQSGTIVRGLIKEIHPPAAVSEDKQRVVLVWPTGEDAGVELGCNLVGEHIHLDQDKCGKVLTMTATKASTFYVSKFDDGGRFLTVRDGVTFEFHEPAPGTVPTVDDRLKILADHYVKCMEAAHKAIEGSEFEMDTEEVRKLSMSIWIDTKHQARVDKKTPVPTAEPEPEMHPAGEGSQSSAPGREGVEPVDPPPATPQQVSQIVSMPLTTLIEKAAKSLMYVGKAHDKLQWRDAFCKGIMSIHRSRPVDSTEMPIWQELLNACHNLADDNLKARIDGAIEHARESQPNSEEWKKDWACCMMVPSLAEEAEKGGE